MVAHARHSNQIEPFLGDDGWKGERPWPAGADPDDRHYTHRKETVSLRFLRHETLVVAAIVIAVVLVAMLVLPLAAGGATGAALLITIFFLAAFIGLVTLPMWGAAMLDDLDDHAGELDDGADDERRTT
jgi:hypothetical protein